jgi:hypothetical protein
MFVPFDESMPSGAMPAHPDFGCAYIAGEPHEPRCGASRQAGSPYCARHHALCHLPKDDPRARRKSRETEALAAAVGGRRGRPGRAPPDRFLRRLESLLRHFSRPNRSCIVLNVSAADGQE